MSQLEIVRQDIENIISLENEFGSTVTITQIAKTYDDDNSLSSSVDTNNSIIVNLHPDNEKEMKIDKNLGQVIFGYATIFFKYQYVINSTTTIIPDNDDIITFNDVKYRVKQLKPWTANGGVAYYHGQLVREDLD